MRKPLAEIIADNRRSGIVQNGKGLGGFGFGSYGREGVDRDMNRYEPLRDRLRQLRGTSEAMFTFAEIEQILGGPLPASAREHREWWANERRPDGNHAQCRAWMESGWFVEDVHLQQGRVTFVESSSAETEG